MSTPSLTGLVVLITRPSCQVASTRQLIESAGATVLSLPLIEVRALTEPAAMQALKDRILELDNYHCLIFVSSNAVNFGADVIDDYWPQFPLGIQVVAIGPATAESARQRFDCEAYYASSGMTSEDILQLPQLRDVDQKKIGIVRARGGRELLAQTLRDRGATVDYIEAYQRIPIEYDADEFRERLRSEGVNVLTVSSGQSLERLTSLIKDSPELMRQLDLVVPSPRVAEHALAAGYARVHNADGADPASFVSTLGELRPNPE